jgi:hypothetical protein
MSMALAVLWDIVAAVAQPANKPDETIALLPASLRKSRRVKSKSWLAMGYLQ